MKTRLFKENNFHRIFLAATAVSHSELLERKGGHVSRYDYTRDSSLCGLAYHKPFGLREAQVRRTEFHRESHLICGRSHEIPYAGSLLKADDLPMV
ncbi:hypothetical protein AVEN_225479-1 [Araneus ventricosus]|uniref:Uncharacterized protein n=1 Tax=Araneus ventricosus TaxID=182803 RepID=A0A4Y2KQV2_ARAVE|nr:hypothetical protein AVEN_225479-1 [Araneus ventricosus]